MEDEDELALLDYRTPKGQLIKLLEQKIKKPEVDDTLGKVLDQFSQLVNEQTAFLDSGIFHMNFAEDALLLQGCGQYYAKRVDKLWDELMQFHARMIKYDELTAKNCTDSNKREERKQEIARLEERLNRGKRKKIVLTEPENEAVPINGCFIFDIDQEGHSELFNTLPFPLPEEEIEIEEEPVAPFEHNFELFDEWRELRLIGEEEKRRNGYSILVGQYHRLRYRFKHYATPSSDDIIYDWSDPEEFNTREGRLISFHHIKHLFEYNDRCLLPDENFTVAKLRLAFVLQKKWILKNKINPDAPYETFKDAWEQYQKEFFENEKRKIQNMPQSTPEELMMFYKALAKKEQIAFQKVEKLRAMGVKNLPVISFENVIVAPVKEGYDGIFDPYIPEDFDTPPPVIDVTEEPSTMLLDGDHEAELSTLLENLSKPPDLSSQALDKSRSDSGYFDGGFEADDDSDHEAHPENGGTGADTPFEFDKENPENTENHTTEPIENTTNLEQAKVPATLDQSELEVTENDQAETAPILADSLEDVESNLQTENALQSTIIEPSIEEQSEPDKMNRAIKAFVQQATSDESFLYKVLENSYFDQTEYLTTIIYNKPEEDGSELESLHGDQIMVYGHFFSEDEDEQKVERQFNKRRSNNVKTDFEDGMQENKKRKVEQTPKEDFSPPKRKKLSQKQIAKLKKGLIEPVKEQKWERFFSLNYQVESGEGEINRVEYESDSDLDEDLNDDADTDVNDTDHMDKSDNYTDLNVSGYHSEPDEVFVNDVSNRPSSTPLPLSQDSGINMDTTLDESESAPQKEQGSTQIENTHTEEENLRSSSAGAAGEDLLTDLCQTTGITRDELTKKSPPIDLGEELTPYEQERERVRSRVADWKNFITPKLKKLDDHDFDIHEYGANMMNKMTATEPKPFSEFVSGKSSAEVVRYFVSSLQLANTLNVEICGVKSGELSNDTFALKLLNKERYHEHFQEYQAPSEESLKDRLKKVKEIRLQNKKKQCIKRKVSDDEPYQPQSILKNRKSVRKGSSTHVSPKRIKILNIVNVVSSTDQESTEQLNTNSNDQQDFDFQQPSTSWQADIVDQQSTLESAMSDIPRTPNRASIDSGFMPSCDEDFLEQFDQLQQIDDALQSTPVKPQKKLKISLVRSNIFD